MGHYIFVFYPDEDADIACGRVELEFDHDHDALEAAEDVARLCQIDVWLGDNLIYQVRKRKVQGIKNLATRAG